MVISRCRRLAVCLALLPVSCEAPVRPAPPQETAKPSAPQASVETEPAAVPAAPVDYTVESVPVEGRDHVRAVFVAGQERVLAVRLKPAPAAGGLSARAFDFWGNPAGDVAVEATGKDGVYLLRPQADAVGWYRLELSQENASSLKRLKGSDKAMETYDFLMFAIVPEPGQPDPASSFGLNTAITSSKGFSRQAQVELARLTGVGWVREIMSWRAINAEPGVFNWGTTKVMADALSAEGLSVLEVFQNCPEWMRPGAPKTSFPDDLLATHAFAKEAAQALAPGRNAFEIWNEQDVSHFATDPPDRFASTVKAASLGFQAADQVPRIVLGPFARHPGVGGYAETLAANDIAPWVNAYSFHTYNPFKGGAFADVIKTHLEVARELGLGEKPIWLSETGQPYGRNRVPDPRETMENQAHYTVVATMRALREGIRPVFAFLLRPYFGGGPSQFGLLDSTYAPFPAYVALAVMCDELRGATALGALNAQGTETLVFASPTGQVAVVLTPQGKDWVELPAVSDQATAVGIMGEPLAMEKTATGVRIAAKGWPVYLRQPGWDTASLTPVPARDQDALGDVPPVVLQVLYPRDHTALDTGKKEAFWDALATNWAPRGYQMKPGESVTFVVEIYNFGPEPIKGTVSLDPGKGFTCDSDAQAYTAEPGAKGTATFTVTAGTEPAEGLWRCTGTANGRPLSPSAARWRIAAP